MSQKNKQSVIDTVEKAKTLISKLNLPLSDNNLNLPLGIAAHRTDIVQVHNYKAFPAREFRFGGTHQGFLTPQPPLAEHEMHLYLPPQAINELKEYGVIPSLYFFDSEFEHVQHTLLTQPSDIRAFCELTIAWVLQRRNSLCAVLSCQKPEKHINSHTKIVSNSEEPIEVTLAQKVECDVLTPSDLCKVLEESKLLDSVAKLYNVDRSTFDNILESLEKSPTALINLVCQKREYFDTVLLKENAEDVKYAKFFEEYDII